MFFTTPLRLTKVPVLNKRLSNSHGDVKVGLWKWPQLVAGSEHLVTSGYSAQLFHTLQRLSIPRECLRC